MAELVRGGNKYPAKDAVRSAPFPEKIEPQSHISPVTFHFPLENSPAIRYTKKQAPNQGQKKSKQKRKKVRV